MRTADHMREPANVSITNGLSFILSRPAGIEITARRPGMNLAMKMLQAPLESTQRSPLSRWVDETPILRSSR
jgi:hypothetical protein